MDITKFVKTPAGGCLSAPLGGVYVSIFRREHPEFRPPIK
nr:MAG TPA: hypothetical protein [Herelleviridae sp.]